MALTTQTTDVSGFLPGEYGDLVIKPTEAESVALQVSTAVVTDSHTFHIPVLSKDTTAAWYSEMEDLSGDDPTFDELIVTPAKVGRVVRISNELADDSSPSAQEAVGTSIGRAIAKAVDDAYFGALPAPAPAGLASLTGVTSVKAGVTAWEDLDPFLEAIAAAEDQGVTVTAFVTSPADYAALLKLKQEADSNVPLLGLDPTAPMRKLISGVPLWSSRSVQAGNVWAIPMDHSHAVMRSDVNVEVSRERYFDTDATAVKAVMRIGFGFPFPEAIGHITLDA